jgi:peptide/nickel transport system ATP-binding protein
MLLEVDGLAVGFRRYEGLVRQREIVVLEGLRFSLARGEVLALAGASGAGKSLVAHALFGILPPNAVTHGQMRLDGTPLDAAHWPAVRGRRMGLVPQSPGYLDPLVRCGRQLAWAMERSGRRAGPGEIAAVLSRFGLDGSSARAFPHQLSGGMARRLMLAMATAGEPDLVVADEPTAGLDPETAARVLDALRRLADGGKGVLLITHDLVRVLPVADRVAVLRDGRLAGIEAASAFAGDGRDLRLDYARALWRAMPENGFSPEATEDA